MGSVNLNDNLGPSQGTGEDRGCYIWYQRELGPLTSGVVIVCGVCAADNEPEPLATGV